MNRTTILVLAALLSTGSALAQTSAGAQAGASANTQSGANAQTQRSGAQVSGNSSESANGSAQAGQKSVGLSSGSTMNAALTNSLDAKKNKPGDPVEARTTQDMKQDGKTVIPKGTKLIGHVTQAQERAGGQSQSALGVAFDRAEMRNGQQMPLNAGIQALAVSQDSAQASAAGDDLMATGGGATSAMGSGSAGGGGLIGGAGGMVGGAAGTVTNVGSSVGSTGGTVGSTVNTATHSTGAVGGLNAGGMLTSNSEGVFGLQGLSLESTASSATQGSTIVSSTRNVHLDSGTQMLLRVAGQAN